jgi:tetratricopeptide (TPR) repeat protein
MTLRLPTPEEQADPPRLLGTRGARGSAQSPAEQRAADLLRRVGEPTQPSAYALEAVERAVLARAAGRGVASRRRRAIPRLAWALASVLVMSSGALAAWFTTRHSQPAPAEHARRLAAKVGETDSEGTEPSLVPRTPVPAVPERSDRPRRASRSSAIHPPSRPLALSSAADASRAASFGAEGALLTKALRALSEEGNPSAALATLDEYVQTYPQGRLLHEAAVARLEALVLAGHRAQALEALEGGLPALAPLGRSEMVLRGELRAAAGRLEGARDDFSAASSRGGSDDVAARALLDLARMQQALGDHAGADGSLRRYLASFPRGAGAEEARRALSDPP